MRLIIVSFVNIIHHETIIGINGIINVFSDVLIGTVPFGWFVVNVIVVFEMFARIKYIV